MITSLQNPLVKWVAGLNRRRERQREGLFLIEGERELQHAATGGIIFEKVLCCPEILTGNERLKNIEEVAALAGNAKVVEVSAAVFAKVAYRDQAGGILAVAKIPTGNIDELELGTETLVLVVEGVEKPGNVGALLRTADGAGVDAVIVCGPGVDLYSPNVVRGSLGALFTVKTFVLSFEQAGEWLGGNGFRTIVSSPAAQRDYCQADYGGRVALVVGSEKGGLSRRWLEGGGEAVRIAMAGQMDSLNVSCSGAILMYEALRQRSQARPS